MKKNNGHARTPIAGLYLLQVYDLKGKLVIAEFSKNTPESLTSDAEIYSHMTIELKKIDSSTPESAKLVQVNSGIPDISFAYQVNSLHWAFGGYLTSII